MATLRTYAGKRQRRTSAFAAPSPATGQFDTRPFGVETEAHDSAAGMEQEAKIQQPKVNHVNSSYLQAQRFGHHLSQISVHAAPSADVAIARKRRRREDVGLSSEAPQTTSVQRQAEGGQGFEAGSHLESRIKGKKEGGQPLDEGTRSFMEPRFGHSFSDVRVHTDSESVQMNQELNAQAFTNGKHIYFGKGKYEPSSDGGKQLLAHELTHTIQQTGGNKLQRKQGSHCTSCGCPTCTPAPSRPSVKPQTLLNRKLIDQLQRQTDSTGHATGCACSSCGAGEQVQRKAEGGHAPGCSCPQCGGGQVQTKLTVGPAKDQFEQEADEVAGRVMNMPDPTQVHSVQHQGGGNQAQRHGNEEHAQRHEDEDHAQTKPIGDHITSIAQRHENHDEHAQTKPIVAPVSVRQTGAAGGTIQRHSSWEHQLLGDIPPQDLAGLGSWQDLIAKGKHVKAPEVEIDKGKKVKKGNVMHVLAQELMRLNLWQQNPPKGTGEADKKKLDPTWDVVLVSLPNSKKPGQPLVVTYGELNTLADYYGNAELMKTADPEKREQLVQSVRQETFFRLKDIYEKLKESLSDKDKQDQEVTDAEKMMADNQLANQKLGFKFKGAVTPDYISGKAGQIDLLSGAQGTGAKGKTNAYGATLARNACHFVPESWHSWAGYHKQALDLAKQAYTKKADATTKRDLGKQLNDKTPGSGDGYHGIAKQLEQESGELANEALLQNGFGDHYLQDSYASGHMLNKTQIMQWYVEYIDTSKEWDYFKDQNWRKVQQMAYRQPGLADPKQYDKEAVQGHSSAKAKNKPRNPQSVEDMQGDWMTRFNALGLQTPASISPGSTHFDLFVWWQKQSMGFFDSRKQTVKSLQASGKSSDVYAAIKSLEADGVIRVNWGGTKHHVTSDLTNQQIDKLSFLIRDQYVPKNKKQFNRVIDAYYDKDKSPAIRQKAAGLYKKMAASVTYSDYLEFMNSAFIQKSTNALHDVFCQDGLEVSSGEKEPLFKVYGDDAMFNAGSGPGVKHSGETANMSRDAILSTAQLGNEGKNTTDAILARLPAYVKPKDFPVTSIEAWHNPPGEENASLKQYCMTDVFPGMSWKLLQKMGPGAAGDLGAISKDAKVHGSDAF